MHHGKSRGEIIHVSYVKTRKFYEIRGGEYCKSRGRRTIFGEKVKLGKFSAESEKFVGNRKKSETEGNASLPQGGWTPLNELIQRTFGQAIDHYPSMAPSIKTSVSAESPCAQQTQVAIIS